MLVPLILSGGAGTRLWPLSRQRHPKQFQPLVGDATMFERTLERVEGLVGLTAPIVVCNADHRPFVEAQLRRLGRVALGLLLEPVGRNTAPAIAVGAEHARLTLGGDPLLLVLPADHLVRDPGAFRAAVAAGRPMAEAGKLVTFGVVPEGPQTGYGYIHAPRDGHGPGEALAVRAFVEKPDEATARAWMKSGEHYWNAGIFLMRASVYLEELARNRPEMIEPCRTAVERARGDAGATMLDPEAFTRCPSDSIDYAIMQTCDRAVVVPMDAGWSDVGNWNALWEASERDGRGNAIQGDVVALDVEGSYLDARHGVIAAIGVRDTVVVATEDAVLVMPRARAQDVKTVVARIDRAGGRQASDHPERPTMWGFEHRLDEVAPGVGRLVVRPKRSASRTCAGTRRVLAVSQGLATVEHGDGVEALSGGSATTLPPGCAYRITNAGDTDLVVIEIDAR